LLRIAVLVVGTKKFEEVVGGANQSSDVLQIHPNREPIIEQF
jgi:hypothetical protein